MKYVSQLVAQNTGAVWPLSSQTLRQQQFCTSNQVSGLFRLILTEFSQSRVLNLKAIPSVLVECLYHQALSVCKILCQSIDPEECHVHI